MRDQDSAPKTPETPRPGIPKDESRLEMMRREKHMSIEERVQLFEHLSRDAAWVLGSARRIR
jgi:hypothetical protein